MIYNLVRYFLKQRFVKRIVYIYFFRRIKRNAKCYSNYNQKPRLFWGPVPIINNKYFSESLSSAGFYSKTVMEGFYSINDKNDYDLYLGDLVDPKQLTLTEKVLNLAYGKLFILEKLFIQFDIFHIPYSGLLYANSELEQWEYDLLRSLGKKIIVMPFGGDAYQYSKVINESLKHALMISYPGAGQKENKISRQVQFWQEKADFRMGSIFIDGFSKWDILPVNYLAINTKVWSSFDKAYSLNDGKNGVVNILHTPNHRGFKGTEFVIDAIERLKEEGLLVNLILLEGVSNEKVKEIMQHEADILTEQLIFIGYGMSGIEGLAVGLPVLSNLDDERYTQVLRRYSYLDECPVMSTTPETIYNNLKILIQNPYLRKELGLRGKEYVEKYHSYAAAEIMFSRIYDSVWYNKNVEFWKLYHPKIKESYNNQSPKIEHPLVKNKIPDVLLKTLNL